MHCLRNPQKLNAFMLVPLSLLVTLPVTLLPCSFLFEKQNKKEKVGERHGRELSLVHWFTPEKLLIARAVPGQDE